MLFPNAKINLGLHVVARRPDGYHNIETVFFPLSLCDTLMVRCADVPDYVLTTHGLSVDAAPEDNLLVRTYRLFQREFGISGIEIDFEKRIPFGAGLGGGSADAAFMAVELNRLFNLELTPEQLQERVARIGADCAFFIRNTPALATGIGEVLSPVCVPLHDWHLLLVKPNVHVSTAAAYKGIVPRKPACSLAQVVQHEPVESWRELLHNDFEPSVFAQFPQIAHLKQQLYTMGATYAAMSGSGASVYGLFKSQPAVRELFTDCFVHQEKIV